MEQLIKLPLKKLQITTLLGSLTKKKKESLNHE